jgi:hypothetical protein
MGWAFATASGLWGVAMIANLIVAIRLCYRIEARSPRWARKPGSLPAYAAWLPVMLNHGVARDPETQALRRRMNLHFAAMPIGFLLLYALIHLVKKDVDAAQGLQIGLQSAI